MSLRLKACLATFCLLAANTAAALQPADHVENFRLMDHLGSSHHLYYFDDMDAVVVVVQDRNCATASAQAMNRLAGAHENVQFFLLSPAALSERSAVQSFAASAEVPVLLDEAQLVTRALGLGQSGEAIVIDPKLWQVAYRGDVAGVNDALDAVLAGQPVDQPVTSVEGCAIDLPVLAEAEPTYVHDVAPILEKSCVNCHRPGGIGPWQMTDYNMVRGYSLMIREVLMTQRMPPWHADPFFGHWANDRSLSVEEQQTIVQWAENGAPRGEGDDPLRAYGAPLPEWGDLGQPDLVINIPASDIPATGTVDYKYKYVTNPLDRDVWVRASQILPGDRTVLHHVITRFGMLETEGPRKGRLSRRGPQGGLAGYVPGMIVRELPEGTGTLLPAGATIEFQMHYTTSGKATSDASRIGIYFHEEPPEHQLETMVMINARFQIPANTKSYADKAVRVFEKDSLVYSLLPHSHYRGKAAKFVAEYPDGTKETLLNVPNYDFNWQTTYNLQEPRVVPAGTRLTFTKWWDNSAQNPANPDPNRVVGWGEQSWDEMIFGAITYRELNEEERQQFAGSE